MIIPASVARIQYGLFQGNDRLIFLGAVPEVTTRGWEIAGLPDESLPLVPSEYPGTSEPTGGDWHGLTLAETNSTHLKARSSIEPDFTSGSWTTLRWEKLALF